MSIAVLLASIVIFTYAARGLSKRDLSAAPILVTSLATIVAILAANGVVYSSFAMVWSNLGAVYNSEESIYYFFCITILYAVIHFCFKPGRKMSAENWQRFNNTLHSLRVGSLLILPLVLLSAAFAFAHFLILNKSVILFTPVYLQMASDDALQIRGSLPEFVQSSYKMMGLLSFVGLAFLVFWRRLGLAFLLALPSAWFLLFEVAGHSRYAAVFLAAFSVSLFVLGTKRSHRFVALVGLVLAVLAYSAALQGRNHGEHGFSTLGSFFQQAMFSDPAFILRMLTNLFEGVFSVAESFYYLNIELPEPYKLLSFSPLPSFLDGFAANWQNSAVRLDTYVPMGALGELLLFGTGYLVFYFATVALALFLTVFALRRGMFLTGNLMALVFTIATFMQFSYSVRTSYRFFLICIAAYLLAAIIGHRRRAAALRRAGRIHPATPRLLPEDVAKIGR